MFQLFMHACTVRNMVSGKVQGQLAKGAFKFICKSKSIKIVTYTRLHTLKICFRIIILDFLNFVSFSQGEICV